MLPSPDPILEIQQVTRRFSGLVAVNNVSLSVHPGEIFGLIGPNGAGKTTMFNIITGLIPPSSGRLIYQNTRLNRLRPHQIAAQGIARTFQNLRLFQNLSVLENVAIARHLHVRSNLLQGLMRTRSAVAEEEQIIRRAIELLEWVGLAAKAEQTARNLAYGDQRRLELARALAVEPRLLLLDEPAAGMNPNEKAALSQLIRQLRDAFDLTIILIEHHVPLVMGLCHRIAVLDFGQLIAIGQPEAVRTDPAVIAAYLGVGDE